VQFFLFLNDLAGRLPFLDQSARFFYVGAVPLLAALFFGQLLLVSRESNAAKARIALAVVLALLFVALIGIAIEFFAVSWHLGTLSPRPFMTRRIHWLVVEPQDNSFPCYEVAIAAILATGMAFSNRKWGIAGALLTVLLALTRLYCGTNFLADVAVGALLGSGLCAAFGALCTAEHPFERAPLRDWAISSAVVALSLGASYVSFAQTPRFAAKLPLLWSSTATAANGDSPEVPRKATRAARVAIGEGEGIAEIAPDTSGAPPETPSAEELALSKRSHLFLPVVEKFLRGKLAPRARPFHLLDVEVAPVKAGNTTYRCAAIRFEIAQKVPDLRRQTAHVAARLVKIAFQSDSLLQNVDVTAILRGDGAQIDGSEVHFAGDEVPVFTASVARQNLRVPKPLWANDPRLDGGSWLRARSRLYVNQRILPVSVTPAPKPSPKPSPKAAPKPSPTPVITPAIPFKIPAKRPTPPRKPWPTATPLIKIPAKPSQTPTLPPKAVAKPFTTPATPHKSSP